MNIIAHNLVAMNAARQNKLVTGSKAKATERLSSGYKINRAADDAAGLAISEKMRRQIKGLTRASENAQDGISLVQVADGALAEMHDILQRMNVLSVQSANDTNASTDREYLQSEIDQLGAEINRISKNTSFNEINLFDMPSIVGINGDYANAPFDERTNIGGTNYSRSKTMDFSRINADNIDELVGKKFAVKCSMGCNQTFNFTFTDNGGSSAAIAGGGSKPDLNIVIDITGMTSGSDVTSAIYNQALTQEATIKGLTPPAGSIPAGTDSIYIGHDNGLHLDGDKLVFFAPDGSSSGRIMASELDTASRTLNLHVGAESYQLIPVHTYKINAATLGVGTVDITTQRGAESAIGAIKNGLEKVSSYRSYYGATQNRLEHTIKNLDNIIENTTAAESQIRDTDMSKTMVEFSNLNILDQAGISMMTQANQINQNILSLLG